MGAPTGRCHAGRAGQVTADGGPAFPRAASWTPKTAPEDGHDHGEAGMTLRDWYKGQALLGLVMANENPNQALGWQADSVASAAGEYADAMLKEREKARR